MKYFLIYPILALFAWSGTHAQTTAFSGELTDAEQKVMKADMQKSMELSCLYYEANVKSIKAPEDPNAKMESDKARETFEDFTGTMVDKYKNANPDKALLEWAEEEMKKCPAMEEAFKLQQEQQRIKNEKKQ